MRDTNGDLRMDNKERVTDQYGRLDGDPQNNANGFYWALDNRMYTAGAIHHSASVEERQVRSAADAVARRMGRDPGRRGTDLSQHERVRAARRSRADVVFRAQSEPAAHARQLRTARGRQPGLNTVWPVRPNPGPTAPISSGSIAPTARWRSFTSVCAPMVYRGDRLPAELYGNVFVAEPAANLVSRIIVYDDGTTLRARKAYERGEFLASTDERFRPVYLTRMLPTARSTSSTCIAASSSTEFHHRVPARSDPLRESWNSRPASAASIASCTRRPGATPPILSPAPLATARRSAGASEWLAARHGPAAAGRTRGAQRVPRLTRLASSAADWRTRLHALWTLDGLDAIEPATVTAALEDPNRDVRMSAMRLAERWLGEKGIRFRQPCSKDSTIPTGRCVSSSRHLSARCRRERGIRGRRPARSTGTIPSSWTQR